MFTVTYQDQSCSVVGPEMIKHSKLTKLGRQEELTKHIDKDARTVYEAFKFGASLSEGAPCLGWRNTQLLPFQWLTYNETMLRAHNLGSGLLSLGLSPGSNTKVGIMAKNCPEWIIAELGMFSYSIVSVPLYRKLEAATISHIITECELSTVLVQDEEAARFVLESLPANKILRHVVTIRDVRRAEVTKIAADLGVKIVRFSDLEKWGAGHNIEVTPPTPDSLAVICYSPMMTSDTRPKGVMLSHQNIISAASACLLQLGESAPTPSDLMISYLPMCYTLERCCQMSLVLAGGRIGFFCGHMRGLANDLRDLRPTVVPTVPRVLNRIYEQSTRMARKHLLTRWIMNSCLDKMVEREFAGSQSQSVWSRLVFTPLRRQFGNNVRLMVVGSAPVADHVISFMRVALGCPVLESYGLTECAAPCCLTLPGDLQPGHVGPPLACNLIKLVDCPDMEYFASHSRGEICIKGTNVFQGYYRDDERSLSKIDEAGWLHTGDIGEWTAWGTLRVIDKIKTIFKLSNGDYVDPNRLEAVYVQSQYINQIFVHGSSLKSRTVAVVVPDEPNVKFWADSKGIASQSLSALCNNKELKTFIMEELTSLGHMYQLSVYEKVASVYLHPDLFSIENGLMTHSGLLKRRTLETYFKPQIEIMYGKLP